MRAGLLWLILLCAGTSHARWITPPERRVHQLLASQKLIRMFVDWAPGMGHQSASANVLKRLRQLGYTGPIEVVYFAPDPSDRMLVKMAALFPGFDRTGGKIQDVPSENLRYVPFDDFNPQKSERVDLAITGADDNDLPPHFLNANILLTLQPQGWSRRRTLRINWPTRIEEISLDEFKGLGLHFDITEIPASLSDESTPAAFVDEATLTGLREIYLARTRLDTATYYGHGLYHGSGQLENYIGALMEAQRSEPETFDKPIVVPIFLETEAVTLETLRAKIATSFIFRNRVTAMAAGDPKLASTIATLAPGQILIVTAGRVPHDLFAYFMTNSTIAPVAGGRNSMNLMGQTGRPYLTSNDHEEHHFVTAKSKPPRALKPHASGFDEARRVGHAMLPQAYDGRSVTEIAQFIRSARHEDSPVSRLFRASRLSNDANSDLVVRGLLKVIKHRPGKLDLALEPVRAKCERALSDLNWRFQLLLR